MPFAEPLYDMVVSKDVIPEHIEPKVTKEPLDNLNDFAKIWNISKRKMILVGLIPPNIVDHKHLNFLAARADELTQQAKVL